MALRSGLRFLIVLGLVAAVTTVALAGKGIALPQEDGGTPSVRGSGKVVSEDRSVSGFSSIALSGIGKLTIRQTGSEKLTVRAEDNILPLIETKIGEETLRLGFSRGARTQPTKLVEYVLEVKDLKSLAVSGAGSVDAREIRTGQLTITLSGAANILLEGGGAEGLDLKLSGVGKVQAEAFPVKAATVFCSGTGKAVVNASESVRATVSGIGVVEYVGVPPSVQQTVSGMGKVRRKGA